MTRYHMSKRKTSQIGHIRFWRAAEELEEHYHPGCLEIVAVISGNQTYAVGGKEYSLFGGNVFTTYTNEVHSTGQAPQAVSELVWFQLNMEKEEGFLGLREPFDRQLYQRMKNWDRRIVKMESEAIMRLLEALQCFEEAGSVEAGGRKADGMESSSVGGLDKRLRGHSLLLGFLTELLEADRKQAQVADDILRGLTFIEEHLTDRIELEQLAACCGLSVSWMKAKFRDQIGMSPRDYINRRKVERAKVLLEEGALSVTEIAFMLDFGSSNYFSTVFKRITGLSPTEYRRN